MNSGPAPSLVGSLCFVVGLAIAVAAGMARQHANEELTARHFDQLASEIASDVSTRMRAFEFGLRGMRGIAIAQAGLPTLKQVRRYGASRDIDREFPGARGFGLIWRVPPAGIPSFLANMRSAGQTQFEVKQVVAHTDDRFVISYVEPEEPNRAALGLDIASEDRRRTAALAAQATNQAAITEPITLVQATGQKQRSFLLLLPIPNRMLFPDQKVTGVAGWSYAPVIIDEVLATLQLPEDMVWLQFRDADSINDGMFYASAGAEPDIKGLPVVDMRLPMFNRQWIIHMRARPAMVEGLHLTSPALIVALGTLMAALLGGLAFLLAQRRRRSRALRLERARRAAIVEASDDAIVGVGMDGTITEWNGGAERLFGFVGTEVLGSAIRDVLPAPGWLDEDAAVLASIGAGRRVAPFESQRRHRDGRLVDVSVSAAPIHDGAGQLAGLAKTFRDIRVAKAARIELEALNASLDRQVRERTGELDRTLRDLRNIVDALPSMIGYWDRELRNRMANRAYASWFSMQPDQLQGRRLDELLPADTYDTYRPVIEAALRGESRTFHRNLQRPRGGATFHALIHFLPDVVGGVVQGFYVLVHDVSELQEQRTALEAEKREKAGLLATIDAHAIVSTTDRNGLIVAVNERFCQISGYGADELIGRTHRIVSSGVHPPEFWHAVRTAIAGGGSWQGEICNRAKDGTLYWVDSIIAPFMDERGRIEKIIAFSTDITARKVAELELRQALATLESILESATQVAIVATDREGTVTLFNSGAARLLGYAAAQVVGQANVTQWYPGGAREARADESAHGNASDAASHLACTDATAGEPFDCDYLRADGSLVPVTASVAPIRDEDGTLLGHIHVAYDIRDRLAQEALLRDAVSAAERANEAKSQFLANMSHEIRTPLNAVIGLAWLLGRTTLDREQAAHVSNIRAAGGALLAIVNDVLDLSKIEAGEMPIEHVTFGLRNLCSDLQAMFGTQARAKGLALRLVPDSSLPDALVGDPIRVRQVLVNLLANAIKFTEHGEVGLAIRLVDMDGDRCRLAFTVRDTGIGIAPAEIERLFMPFSQADVSTTRRFGGTGLGLSIVQNLVQMMDGRIAVEGVPGEGSRFEVDLPFALGDPQAISTALARGASGQRLPGVRVLLVDDSEINLTVAGRLLEIEGAVVTSAKNGAEAVGIVASRPDLQLILMDIQMPVMDGLEAARRILQQEGPGAPPLVALTAGNTVSERARAREAGFVDIFSKPIDPEQLVLAIRHLLAMAPVSEHDAPEPGNTADDWPEIDGIDTAQARRRLGGDVDLFRRMLNRLLALCAQADSLHLQSQPDSIALAHLMHLLKGNASTLAASRLATTAGDIEAACRQGRDELIGPALEDLARQARHLESAAASFLAAAAPVTAHGAEGFDRTQMDAFLRALRSHDLSALGMFQRLAPALRDILEAKAMDALTAQVQALRFAEALATLQASTIPDEEQA